MHSLGLTRRAVKESRCIYNFAPLYTRRAKAFQSRLKVAFSLLLAYVLEAKVDIVYIFGRRERYSAPGPTDPETRGPTAQWPKGLLQFWAFGQYISPNFPSPPTHSTKFYCLDAEQIYAQHYIIITVLRVSHGFIFCSSSNMRAGNFP